MDNITKLNSLIESIKGVDKTYAESAQLRLDNLTKPQGSLGRLEELAVQLSCIQRTDRPNIGDAAVLVCAADHGVVAQGVTSFPSEVTRLMVANFDRDGAAVNQIANVCGARVHVHDIGVGNPTADMSQGPAMSREECADAIMAGADAVRALIDEKVDIVCLGEMGIGNSAAAAALTASFTDAPLAEVVGRGAGLDDETLAHKTRVLEGTLEINQVDELDALGKLAAVGGREIAMMAGIVLGTASASIPVVSDGFISGSAVLAATALAPQALDYIIFSHRSVEPGHDAMYRHLGTRPLFDLDMRLGEGTGAVLALPMIRSAAQVLSGMETFEEAGIVI